MSKKQILNYEIKHLFDTSPLFDPWVRRDAGWSGWHLINRKTPGSHIYIYIVIYMYLHTYMHTHTRTCIYTCVYLGIYIYRNA